jgi:tetratricopeptide (TPR) repeat protein
VDAALDAFGELASGKRAAVILKLANRGLERIERAIEDVDDSGAHCANLLDRARGIHLAAARVVRPEPVRLARDLFVREMAGDYDTFQGVAALYADVLGEEGVAEYRRLAAAAWERLTPLRGGRELQEALADYDRLAEILDFFAEQDGDVDTRVALRTKGLSSAWKYLQLAEFCCAHGREDEPLCRAEEGLWLFEDDRPDERLVAFAAELLIKAGRSEDAEAHLWRAFENLPSLELYKRIRRLASEEGRDRAVKFLDARLAALRDDAEQAAYVAALKARFGRKRNFMMLLR